MHETMDIVKITVFHICILIILIKISINTSLELTCLSSEQLYFMQFITLGIMSLYSHTHTYLAPPSIGVIVLLANMFDYGQFDFK